MGISRNHKEKIQKWYLIFFFFLLLGIYFIFVGKGKNVNRVKEHVPKNISYYNKTLKIIYLKVYDV